MYDLLTNKEVQITEDASYQERPFISGNKIVWEDNRNANKDIYMYDLLTNKEVQITTDSSNQHSPSVYESKIIWEDHRSGNGDIYLCDLEGNTGDITEWCNTLAPEGGLRQITNNPDREWYPLIHGDKIVWLNIKDWEIYLYDLSTNKERKITDTPTTNDKTNPSIYGDKIIWSDNRNGGWDIYIYDLSTNEEKQITLDSSDQVLSGNEMDITHSIYEDKLIWSDFRNGNWDIYLCDLEGNTGDITEWCNTLAPEGGLRQITNNIQEQSYPSIYNDKIVWHDYRNADIDIYMYDLPTNKEIQVTGLESINLEELFPNDKIIGGYDFVNNDNYPMDNNGHGTHCAGIAAGNGVLKGVAPDAKLYAYKVLSSNGGGSSDDIIVGIERATDPNQDGDFSDSVDIISMSLGINCRDYTEDCGPDDSVSQAVDNAVDNGVVVIVSAGNCGPGGNKNKCPKIGDKTIGSPGTARKAITVGATFDRDYDNAFYSSSCFEEPHNPGINDVACFSSRGPVEWIDESGNVNYLNKPDIVAPGVETCAAQWDTAYGIDENYNNPDRPDIHRCLDDKHIAISGTSMAAPHVAGAVALLKQKNPDWSPEEIKMALKNTAVDIGEDINTQGAGRVDVLEAMDLKPSICGNNLKEEGEECDGTDDSLCPGRCDENCLCQKPQSKIVNNEDSDLTGQLMMKLQKKVSEMQEILLDLDNLVEIITIRDVDYTVELVSASDDSATIRINGELKEIPEGAIEEIEGIKVYVKSADESDFGLSVVLELSPVIESDSWIDEEIVVDKEIVVPANGLIKLDIGEDNLGNLVFEGWNNLNVLVSEAGDYRVYASFEVNGQVVESSWEFEVSVN